MAGFMIGICSGVNIRRARQFLRAHANEQGYVVGLDVSLYVCACI